VVRFPGGDRLPGGEFDDGSFHSDGIFPVPFAICQSGMRSEVGAKIGAHFLAFSNYMADKA
jgi:hypothetical protein